MTDSMNDILAKIDLNKKYGAENIDENDLSQSTYAVINQLFNFFQAIFPAYRQAWPTQIEFDAAKRQWYKAFVQAKFSNLDHIKLGVSKIRLRKSAFVPSVGEFIALCSPSPEDLGAPSTEKAFDEASKNSHPCADKTFSHEAVRYAWSTTGSWLMRSEARSRSFPIFEKNYMDALRLYGDGRIMQQIKSGEEVSKPSVRTKSVALQALSALKASLK